MEYSHARRRAEIYLDPCFVFTLSLEIASLQIFFIDRSPLVQCSLAVRLALLFASELRNARPFWCPLFVWLVFQQCSDPTCPVECIISDVVFRVFLQYTRLLSRQLACSQLEMAFARTSSMSDHFCPSSEVFLLCGWCYVTRKHDEPRLTTYQGKTRS